ncbi:hypothetical protein T439DRAFT_354820 [Meredithblackwellia eburnea MCA 4105]
MSSKLRISTTFSGTSSSGSPQSAESAKLEPTTTSRSSSKSPISPISAFISRSLRLGKKSPRPTLDRSQTLPVQLIQHPRSPSDHPTAKDRQLPLTTGRRRQSTSFRQSLEAVFSRSSPTERSLPLESPLGEEKPDLEEDEEHDFGQPESPTWRLDQAGAPQGFGAPLARFNQPLDRIEVKVKSKLVPTKPRRARPLSEVVIVHRSNSEPLSLGNAPSFAPLTHYTTVDERGRREQREEEDGESGEQVRGRSKERRASKTRFFGLS